MSPGPASTKLRLGIVGGGSRCRMLLEMFGQKLFKNFEGVIVAVADLEPDAPGMVKAREMGLITTGYKDLLERKDIDIILELTGARWVQDALARLVPANLGKKYIAVNNIFYDLLRIRGMELEAKIEQKQTVDSLKAILDAIDENMMIIDPNFMIADVNEAMEKCLGLSKADIVGKTCHQITHRMLSPCSTPDHPCPLKDVIETGKPVRTTHRHYTGDHKKHYDIALYPI
ncbi:MAG: PAS domain-containing protein, partial [Deltaproteobacteria bacterium]|nr:PAS domain-containing protein [Deltaproteobacteria bacterium]